jgi:hypothetical protein
VSGGCGEDALGQGADGGTPDGGPYNDMTQATNWSVFHTQDLSPSTIAFYGATFDGRYLTLAPAGSTAGGAVHYDTQGPFKSAASWSFFDEGTLDATARGYEGAVFDGRYVYLVPSFHANQLPSGLTARYDTKAVFGDGASWTLFDVSTLAPNAGGFAGGTFDGRYVYFISQTGSSTARFDAQGSFTTASSWAFFDMSALGVGGFTGAVFDGTYIYFVPLGTMVARLDTRGSFDAASWTTFNVGTVSFRLAGFQGGVFDGRYVYFAPAAPTGGRIVMRYDTNAPFAVAASWSTFDVQSLSADAGIFTGGTFDGRYVYFAPSGGTAASKVVRYDTSATFGAPASWSTFDPLGLVESGATYAGAVFDGRYVYFVPRLSNRGDVLRFDARSPPSMPSLPQFHGSFL